MSIYGEGTVGLKHRQADSGCREASKLIFKHADFATGGEAANSFDEGRKAVLDLNLW